MGAGEPWGWGVSILGRESGRGGPALCPPELWGLQPGLGGGEPLVGGQRASAGLTSPAPASSLRLSQVRALQPGAQGRSLCAQLS